MPTRNLPTLHFAGISQIELYLIEGEAYQLVSKTIPNARQLTLQKCVKSYRLTSFLHFYNNHIAKYILPCSPLSTANYQSAHKVNP